MAWNKIKSAVLLYAAPSLLCAVVAVQRCLMQTHHLSAWKGGGFGMFSTAGKGRGLTVNFVIKNGDSIRVSEQFVRRRLKLSSDMPQRLRELLVMPSQGRLRQVARELAKEEWVSVIDENGKTEYPMMKKNVNAKTRYQVLQVHEVQVEIWEYHFDSSGPRLQLTHLITVSESV